MINEPVRSGDYIIRATAAGETVRAFAVRSTEMAAVARETHRTLPVVTAALGRLLSAGAMMGSMMKGDWIYWREKWYYLNADGKMATDRNILSSGGVYWYYVDESGVWDEKYRMTPR